MNAQLAGGERQALAQRLRGMLGALEKGDEQDFEQQLGALLRAREEGLFVHLARLTRSLHQALSELQMDSRLADLAGSDIPDACGRLDYVVQVTERAAHRTLDLVEDSQRCALSILQHAQALAGPPGMPESLAGDAEQLRANLRELAQAQEYQDIAGQTIRRVITLVRNVESALLDLLRAAGSRPQAGSARSAPAPLNLRGPAMPGEIAASQQDADELLASLGF
jgi:chemotaxis protein CheZ